MAWGRWSWIDDRGLPRFITKDADRWLSAIPNPLDFPDDGQKQRRIVEALYDALLASGIRYALEEYQPEARQHANIATKVAG